MLLLLSTSEKIARDSLPEAVSAALATISTDTGALAPGHRDFARYDTPGLCGAAAQRAYAVARGTLAVQAIVDTLHDARTDTAGIAVTAAVVRRCLARFTVSDTVADDYQLLFMGAILSHEETLAQSILARMVSHERSIDAQVSDKIAALTYYLSLDDQMNSSGLSRPPFLQVAQIVAHDLERTGSVETKLQVAFLYLQYWSALDSLPAVRAAAETLLAEYRQGPAAHMQAQRGPRYAAYRALMRAAFFLQPDSMPAVAQRAIRDSVQLPFFTEWSNAATLSPEQVMQKLSPVASSWTQSQSQAGLIPVVHGVRWYSAPGVPAADTVFPAPGRVSAFIAGGGARVAARIRQWRSRYDSQQLAITVFNVSDDTAAYWWNGDDDVIDGPLTISVRGDRARWYYQEYERLAVNVALETRRVQFKAWPFDRKTVVSPQPNLAQFIDVTSGPPLPGTMILADRTGHIIWFGNLIDESAAFERLLAWTITHTEETRQ